MCVKKDLRLHIIRVALTADEYRELLAYAARQHLSISTAVRRAVLLDAERIATSSLDPDPDSLETGTD